MISPPKFATNAADPRPIDVKGPAAARGRVLALAYGYGVTDVSEAYTAYCLIRQIAATHEVTVVTRDATSAESNGPRLIRVPTTSTFVPRQLRRGLKLEYFEFNYKVWRQARSGRFGTFDLCHHVSPISFRYPDLLSTLPVPFLWGPVGGSLPYPKGFEAIGRRESLLFRLRELDGLRLRVDPLLTQTLSRAARIVVTSSDAIGMIPAPYRRKTAIIGEGVDTQSVLRSSSAQVGMRSDFIFSSGRLAPSKGTEFLLQALAKTGTPRLVITGDGPERKRLENMASELGLSNRVQFLGSVSKETNLALMAQSRYCVFPSLKEAFGHVNLEAMANGKAVVAIAHGGPKDIVLDEVTGILLRPREPEELVSQLVTAINRLTGDPDLCERLGQAGRIRARDEYDWTAIGRRYLTLYEEILRSRRATN